MALRQDWSQDPCPIARTLDAVGDPWVLLILREAMLGARRYEQFKQNLRIAENVLSRRLAQMVEDGLLYRSPYRGQQRTHEEYLITESGEDLLPVLAALARWGGAHTEAPERHVEMLVRHVEAGHESTTATVCSECGEALTQADRAYERRWVN